MDWKLLLILKSGKHENGDFRAGMTQLAGELQGVIGGKQRINQHNIRGMLLRQLQSGATLRRSVDYHAVTGTFERDKLHCRNKGCSSTIITRIDSMRGHSPRQPYDN